MKGGRKTVKKGIFRSISLALLLCVMTALAPAAGAASADIMFSDPSVIVGSTATVNVYSTTDVAGVDLTLVYDADYLTYTGFSGGLGNASVQDKGGSLSIVDYNGSGAARFSLNLSFTAKKIGQTTIRPTACTVSDGGGDFIDTEYASHSACVTVTSASTDCTLRALYIEPGTLSPGFSAGTTSYSVTVPNSATWLAVTPVKNDNAATYTISGNDWLNVGLNYVTVTVTAGNGAQRTYTLAVTRLGAEAAQQAKDNTVDTAPEVVPVTVKTDSGAELTVGQFTAENIPAGFEGTELTIGENKVSAIRSKDGRRTALWCASVGGESFYLYDESSGTVTPMDTVTAPGGTYTILNVTLLSSLPPEGCRVGTLRIGEREVSAFVPEESAEYAILYAVNPAGESGYYLYDTKETTLQRLGLYGGSITEEGEAPSPTPEATPEAIRLDDDEPEEADAGETEPLRGQKLKTTILAIAAGVFLLVAVVFGVLLLRREEK